MNKRDLLVAIYADYEGYPPTINAVCCLAENFETVYLIHRQIVESTFPLPPNVKVISSSPIKGIHQQQTQNLVSKVVDFFTFVFKVHQILINKSVKHFLIYDPFALLAANLTFPFHRKKIIVWYHNHDILNILSQRFMSVGWFASKFEKVFMRRVSIFSLPAFERKEYYGESIPKFFLIPNYPSKQFYQKLVIDKVNINEELRIVYQGMVGAKRGIELVIRNLRMLNKSLPVFFYIKGHCSPEYKIMIEQLARDEGVFDKLRFYKFSDYLEVPKLASTCHIGIAIQEGIEIMHKSLGSSSNKIYEYAALGVPVILFDNQHFKEYLSRFSWAFFSNGKNESFIDIISQITKNYAELSSCANDDFLKELNFELAFNQAANSFIKATFS